MLASGELFSQCCIKCSCFFRNTTQWVRTTGLCLTVYQTACRVLHSGPLAGLLHLHSNRRRSGCRTTRRRPEELRLKYAIIPPCLLPRWDLCWCWCTRSENWIFSQIKSTNGPTCNTFLESRIWLTDAVTERAKIIFQFFTLVGACREDPARIAKRWNDVSLSIPVKNLQLDQQINVLCLFPQVDQKKSGTVRSVWVWGDFCSLAAWVISSQTGPCHFVTSESDGCSSDRLCANRCYPCDNRPLCFPRTYEQKLSLLKVTNESSGLICPNKEAYLYLVMLYLFLVTAKHATELIRTILIDYMCVGTLVLVH